MDGPISQKTKEAWHRVVCYREFIWTKKFYTQLFNMKFHRGGNEC